MSVILEVVVPAADFALGRSLQVTANDGARFEFERMVPTTDRVIPYFWVHDTDFAALEASLPETAEVLDVRLLDEYDDRALFRVEWSPDADGLIRVLNEYEATIIEAIGTAERWEFQFRFSDSTDIAAFHADCERAGVRFDLRRLYRLDEPDAETSGLTPLQRETLVTALEEGYFSIPRRVTATELAERLGVSDQAISERLRRAQTTLFTTLLLAGDDPDD